MYTFSKKAAFQQVPETYVAAEQKAKQIDKSVDQIKKAEVELMKDPSTLSDVQNGTYTGKDTLPYKEAAKLIRQRRAKERSTQPAQKVLDNKAPNTYGAFGRLTGSIASIPITYIIGSKILGDQQERKNASFLKKLLVYGAVGIPAYLIMRGIGGAVGRQFKVR